MVKMPVNYTQKGASYGWEFMWRIGLAGDVIGKEVGSSPGKREVRCSAAREMCVSGGANISSLAPGADVKSGWEVLLKRGTRVFQHSVFL